MRFNGHCEAFIESFMRLPNRSAEVLPGVLWGDCSELFTPAYWKYQYNLFETGFHSKICYRLGETILEEVVACLLGGYGIPAEIGLLAFNRLKDQGLIHPKTPLELIFGALSKPFELSNGSTIKYRFANQKSKYITALLNRDDLHNIPVDNDHKLRTWLLQLDGIGLKTASWVTRNWLDSNRVAILDIHIVRAGILAGLYEQHVNVTKDYLELEKKYIDFCLALEVDASKMDAIIWEIMKKNNRLVIRYIDTNNY